MRECEGAWAMREPGRILVDGGAKNQGVTIQALRGVLALELLVTEAAVGPVVQASHDPALHGGCGLVLVVGRYEGCTSAGPGGPGGVGAGCELLRVG